MTRAALLCAALLVASCRESPVSKPKGAAARGPKIAAKVLTIDTTTLPEKKGYRHLVVFAGGKVRLGNELDHWRLFDLQRDTVTFVDATTRSYRTETLRDLVAKREKALAGSLPVDVPRARFVATPERRTVAGIEARQYVVTLGAYRRELWFSARPIIGGNFHALLVASDPISVPFAPAMREVERALMDLQDFPVAEHSEMPWDGGVLAADKQLVKVEQRDVPLSWITIPPDYRDVTPPRESAAGPRRGASPAPGRSTRAGE